MKKITIISCLALLAFGCPGGDSTNSNSQPNRPETRQYNGRPLDNSGKPIPGIPDPKEANLSNQTPGATPTPGIPDPKNADITNQKGATPTPGIPDEATRKRMIEELKKKADPVNTAPDVTPKPGKTKPGPLNRPRKANR